MKLTSRKYLPQQCKIYSDDTKLRKLLGFYLMICMEVIRQIIGLSKVGVEIPKDLFA